MFDFLKKKSKKKIFIHIGMQKTGTTYIQNVLFHNKDLLREKTGIDYFTSSKLLGQRFSACHELAYKIMASRKSRLVYKGSKSDYLSEFKEQLASSTSDLFLLSSEELSLLNDEQIQEVSEIVPKDFEVKIIIYFREQVDFSNSLFKQYKKVGRDFNFSEFLSQFNHLLNYYEVAKSWERVFGKGSVTVGLYEDVYSKGIVEAFFELIDNPRDINGFLTSMKSSEKVNVSLYPPVSLFMTKLNERFGYLRRNRNILEGINKKYSFSDNICELTNQQIADIRNSCLESNLSLNSEFLRSKGDPFKPYYKTYIAIDNADFDSLNSLALDVAVDFIEHLAGK